MKIRSVAVLLLISIMVNGCGSASDNAVLLSEACASPATSDGERIEAIEKVTWVGSCTDGSCDVLPLRPEAADCTDGMVYHASFECPDSPRRVLLRNSNGTALTRVGNPCPFAGFDDASWGTRVEGTFSSEPITGFEQQDMSGEPPEFEHSILYQSIDPGYLGE